MQTRGLRIMKMKKHTLPIQHVVEILLKFCIVTEENRIKWRVYCIRYTY
jgi:hypothetical protein